MAGVYQLDTCARDQIGKNGVYPGALMRTIDLLPVPFDTGLRLSLNIDNVFDTSTAAAYYPCRNRTFLAVTEARILSQDWQLETSNYVPNPLFQKSAHFFPPITARLGVRFSF